MNEAELEQGTLRSVLHHAVDHVHAPVDLASRVEVAGVARRRRTARWSVAGTVALVAVGVTAGVLISGGTKASSGTVYASPNGLPSCAASADTHQRQGSVGDGGASQVAAIGPVVPGSPVAAVVCRYAAGGHLAGSAKVTEHEQLASLQSALNAGRAYSGSMYCMAGSGTATVVFVYPAGTANLTVTYNRACASLYTGAGSYLVRGDVDQLIADWTGSWQSTASPTAG